MWIWTKNHAFSLKICGFAVCGIIITNLQIGDFWTGTRQKFADLRLRNEPKNLRICDLRTNKKIACPPLIGTIHDVALVYSLLCRWFRFAQLAKGKKFRP